MASFITAQQREALIELYIGYFNRAPEAAGLNYWAGELLAALDAGQTEQQALAGIANRFYDAGVQYGVYSNAMTVEQFITTVYQNVLGRNEVDSDGMTYWTQKLTSGEVSRGQFVREIIQEAKDYVAAVPDSDPYKWVGTYLDNRKAVGEWFANNSTGLTGQAAIDQGTAIIANSVTAATAQAGQTTAQAVAAAQASQAAQQGQTFMLTTGLDSVAGTAGNDTINGAHNTVTLGDVINGGAGTDTFYVGDTGSTSGVNFNLATISGVENLIYEAANGAANTLALGGMSGLQSVTYTDKNSAAENVILNTKGNATSVTVSGADGVTITDAATTDTLASVTIDATNATAAAAITSDALTSLSLRNDAQGATVTAAAGTRTLGVTVNNVTAGTITDDTATSVTVTGSGAASSGFTLTTDAATSIAFAGDKTVSLALTDTGSNTAAVVSSITSTNTAGVTITNALGTGVTFTGGDGKDSIEIGATTKTIDMGAGDDRVLITTGVTALGSGGSANGGDGTDTLAMDADDAATASATTTFEGTIAGFEVLELAGAASSAVAVNLANLDDISSVKVSANIGNALTLNNLASNGTVSYTAAANQSAATTINVTNAATGTNDVLNIGVSSSAARNVNTITAANVETININTDDSASTPSGIAHTMTLTAAQATKLTVSGDAGVTLTLTSSAALETIDTSGVTKGAVTVTTVGTGSVTLTGGNTDTTFDASSVAANKVATITTGAGDDTITGGAGDDVINAGNGTNTIEGGSGKDTMTGGSGVDTYVYSAVTDSQGTKVDVITNFQVGTGGDVIDLSAITSGGAYLGAANGYGAVLTSLTGTAGDVVLDSSTSTLYIDVDGDAALTNADMAIQLTGVTGGLVATNFTF